MGQVYAFYSGYNVLATQSIITDFQLNFWSIFEGKGIAYRPKGIEITDICGHAMSSARNHSSPKGAAIIIYYVNIRRRSRKGVAWNIEATPDYRIVSAAAEDRIVSTTAYDDIVSKAADYGIIAIKSKRRAILIHGFSGRYDFIPESQQIIISGISVLRKSGNIIVKIYSNIV